jgi:hypothetical protein
MTTYHTFNQWHTGDNLIHLHWLRSQAIAHPDDQFVHACDPAQHFQLQEVIQDLPNIRLAGEIQQGSIDAWKCQGAQGQTPTGWRVPGYFNRHPLKLDWVRFHIDWFRHLAKQMGLESKFAEAKDFLFDYPYLHDDKGRAGTMEFDVLVINSRPASGQLAAYTRMDYFDGLIGQLIAKGYKVACTQPSNVPKVVCTQVHHLTCSDIGHLAIRCKGIIGVSTGPMWPCENVFALEKVKFRIIFLDREKVELPGNRWHVQTIGQAIDLLKKGGII